MPYNETIICYLTEIHSGIREKITLPINALDNRKKALVFIEKYAISGFLYAAGKIQNHIKWQWLKWAALLFPIYLALAALIYLGDKDAINAFFYRLFEWLHIPVRSPHGWNYGAFLALLFALLQTGIMTKYRRYLYWLRRYIYYQHPLRIYFLILLGFPIMVFLLFLFYLFADMQHPSAKCEEILCLLETEDMFFAATILCYSTIMLIQLMLYGLFCSVFYLNHERRDEEIDDAITLNNLKYPP